MPRLADHDARRRQITDAATRVVAAEGLEATTFKRVAVEAGVSIRLVQYYFGDKATLLRMTLESVIGAAAARFGSELDRLGSGHSADEALLAIVRELLPADAPRRREAVVLLAFHASSLTTGEVDSEHAVAPVRALESVFVHYLGRARGLAPDHPQLASDAALLSAASTGLVQGMLAGHLTADDADRQAQRLIGLLVS